MNPAREAEALCNGVNWDTVTQEHSIAIAQVFATLALANAIEGIGIDLKDAIQTTNAELGSISMSLGEK